METPTQKQQGLRYNEGKLRMDLIPNEAMTGLAKVLARGAEKYTPRNWENGMSWSSVVASLKRHLTAFEAREDFDAETGLSHIDHVLCNAAFLSHYIKNHPDYDDRAVPQYLTKKVALDIDGVMADFTTRLEQLSREKVRDYEMTTNQRQIYEYQKNAYNFWAELPLINNGINEIKWRPHCYITARPESSREATEHWIQKHNLPLAPIYIVGKSSDKFKYMDELGVDILVEDNPNIYIDSLVAGKCVFLYDQVYNRHINAGYKRITSLTQIFQQ